MACTVQGQSLTGSFSVSGLRVAGRITQVTLNAVTWTALPASPLANRNAIAIQNRSGTEIKVNYDSTVVGYIGMTIINNGERQYDITDAIPIYAKSTSGTPTVEVEELS